MKNIKRRKKTQIRVIAESKIYSCDVNVWQSKCLRFLKSIKKFHDERAVGCYRNSKLKVITSVI